MRKHVSIKNTKHCNSCFISPKHWEMVWTIIANFRRQIKYKSLFLCIAEIKCSSLIAKLPKCNCMSGFFWSIYVCTMDFWTSRRYKKFIQTYFSVYSFLNSSRGTSEQWADYYKLCIHRSPQNINGGFWPIFKKQKAFIFTQLLLHLQNTDTHSNGYLTN